MLKLHEDYGDSENFVLSIRDVGKLLQMSYAVVYYSVQGRTLRNRVVLWDVSKSRHELHQHMSLRHFIMATQRAADPALLSITSPEQEEAFLRGCNRGSKRDVNGTFC